VGWPRRRSCLLYAALAHERLGLPFIQLALEPLVRDVATWPTVIALGMPSSLLIMGATTPVVLWASDAGAREGRPLRAQCPAAQLGMSGLRC